MLWLIVGSELGKTAGIVGMVELCSEADLEACLAESGEAPVFIFKHSTSCPTSAMAYRRVAAYLEEGVDIPPFYLVRVIESRAVSNAISARLGVAHQSPQLILVKGDRVLWDASHGEIIAGAIDDARTKSKIV